MRVLKQSTVIKAFTKRGWSWCEKESGGYLYYNSLCGMGGLFGSFDGWWLKIHEGRLRQHSNVHIVSYWGPFRSMKELEEKLDTIEDIYRELCGTYFPQRVVTP